MEFIWELLKSVIYGIVQGITEWLPISSTGHLILMTEFMPLHVFSDPASNQAFWDMYKVVIQFGSILAVLVLFWNRLWPFREGNSPKKQNYIMRLWFMVVVGCIPAGILGLLFEDLIDSVLNASWVIGLTLIIYGVLFIWMENKERKYRITATGHITIKDALGVGIFQALALIPGTSRSGSTILGATLLGFNRKTAAEYSFFLAIPVMFGASALKIVKYVIKGAELTGGSFVILMVGFAISFFVSIAVIRKLMEYIRNHDFKIFGIYRIALGILVLLLSLIGVI
ncbi:MAG: undecaprenyl-diphosphate phosphatase [Solobacterium sp.]|nr:undecaprenyl-diphosphate phosphatase [Solobacterium sp.]